MLLSVPKLPYQPAYRSTDVWLVIPSKIFIFLWIYSFLNVKFCVLFTWYNNRDVIFSADHLVDRRYYLCIYLIRWTCEFGNDFYFFFYLILGNSQKWAENFYSNFELVRENRGKKYYRISSKQKPKQKKKKRKSSISWWENQRTLKHCIATSLSHSPFEYWNTILRPKKICVKNVFLLVFYSV